MSETPWTPLKLVSWTQGYFTRAGVDAPRLTAELLLAHALRCERLRLYLDYEKPVAPAELAAFRELVKRRAEGEPAAYLLGKKEFFGRPFRVDARVLIPRPETELLVEEALKLLPEAGAALDLCTGSGCVAISLALERPGVQVTAVELSPEAAALARENAAALGARVEVLEGDLFLPVAAEARFQVITANPPYVPTAELPKLARELAREPRLALDGGADGLDVARRIVAEAPRRLAPGGTLLLEMHESHPEALTRLCTEAGFARVEVRPDLAGLPRLLVAAMAA
jgi:release factor glutamine methyltransferase